MQARIRVGDRPRRLLNASLFLALGLHSIRSESEREGYTDQMSQELIGIIGAATVAVALTVPAHAQVDCADWNTAAFFEAAEVSDVTRCLQMGAAPDARDKDGKSPLHFATDNGSAEAVTALLDAGADLDVWDRSGFTPLHRAAAQGSAEVVTALLDAGAAPNVRGETGMTRCMVQGLPVP